jgi:hypothetical protein
VVEASAHCSGHFGYKSSTRKFNAIFHSSFSFMNSKRWVFLLLFYGFDFVDFGAYMSWIWVSYVWLIMAYYCLGN